MTVTNTTRSVQYSGNGSTTSWPFAFAADAASLVVQIYDEELETLTTIGSGFYGVTFTGSGFSSGTVTYPLTGPALPSTRKIVISRSLAAVQTLSLGNQSTFYPALFEAALDRIVMLVQQVADRANRSLAVRVGEAAVAELAASSESRAERALMFDATGLVLEAGPSAGEITSAGVAATSAATSAANALASEQACEEIQDDLETLIAAGMASGISFAPYEELTGNDLQEVLEQLVDLMNDRILTGTANQITVTNANGVAGAPTVSLVLASQTEAEAGTDANKVMTAQRVAQAIAANVPASFNPLPTLTAGSSIRSRVDGEQTVTYNPNPVTGHSFSFIQNGTIRITAEHTSSGYTDEGSHTAASYLRIVRVRNGSTTVLESWTTAATFSKGSFVTRSYDAEVLPGDQILVQHNPTPFQGSSYIKNIRFQTGDVNLIPGAAALVEGNAF